MAMPTKLQETRTFLEESWAELQKVTWPDSEQLKNATIVVLAFCVVVSLIIWIMDLGVSAIINTILGIFGA